MFLGEILAITTLAGMPGVILMTYILKAITNVDYMSKMYIVNLGTVGNFYGPECCIRFRAAYDRLQL